MCWDCEKFCITDSKLVPWGRWDRTVPKSILWSSGPVSAHTGAHSSPETLIPQPPCPGWTLSRGPACAPGPSCPPHAAAITRFGATRSDLQGTGMGAHCTSSQVSSRQASVPLRAGNRAGPAPGHGAYRSPDTELLISDLRPSEVIIWQH